MALNDKRIRGSTVLDLSNQMHRFYSRVDKKESSLFHEIKYKIYKKKFMLNDFIKNALKRKNNYFLVLQFRRCFFTLNKTVE